jgi:transposase
MGWTGEHRGFVVEAYYKNNRSAIATQRGFRTRFALGRNASVPDRKTILLWISNLRATGSTLKRKSSGRPRTVRTPENVEAIRASIQQSPKRSARKHAMALGISSRSLRRILHTDLKLHPYKMMLAQELIERAHANRRAISAEILEQVPTAAVLLSSDEAHFHTSGAVNKQNFRYWAERNPRDF